VDVMLNDFPVNTEFLVLNNFTQQAILGMAFFYKTKALLNFDLGLKSFYSGLIELPFVKQIPFHSLANTVSDVELPPFSESMIPVRIVNNCFKDECVYVQGRFVGINQLYAVARSLNNIDIDGGSVCQVANASNEIITVLKKTPIAVVLLHLNDKDCVNLTSDCKLFNIQDARVDLNPHGQGDNFDLSTHVTIDCTDCTTSPSPSSPPPTEQTFSLYFFRLYH